MRPRFRFPDDRGRDRKRNSDFIAKFIKPNSSEEEIIRLLEEALNHYKDVKLVKDCAKKLGLRLRQLEENEKLELYFDVFKDGRTICCIYKGWGDSGFRLSEHLAIDKTTPGFKDKFYEIFRVCSKNLVNVGITEQDKRNIWLSFEIGIYRDGFNDKVLREAIADFEDAMSKVKDLLNNG